MAHKYFTIPETAEYLRVSRSGVYNLLSRGQLKAVKIGRRTFITREELDRFCAAIASAA